MASIPTVIIHDPGKPGDVLVINEADFSPDLHRLASEPLAKPAKAPKKSEAVKAS